MKGEVVLWVDIWDRRTVSQATNLDSGALETDTTGP